MTFSGQSVLPAFHSWSSSITWSTTPTSANLRRWLSLTTSGSPPLSVYSQGDSKLQLRHNPCQSLPCRSEQTNEGAFQKIQVIAPDLKRLMSSMIAGSNTDAGQSTRLHLSTSERCAAQLSDKQESGVLNSCGRVDLQAECRQLAD